jgi:hypothetical protein
MPENQIRRMSRKILVAKNKKRWNKTLAKRWGENIIKKWERKI